MDRSMRHCEGNNVIGLDDWKLTKKELESQRLQLLIQLEVVQAGIEQLDNIIFELEGSLS